MKKWLGLMLVALVAAVTLVSSPAKAQEVLLESYHQCVHWDYSVWPPVMTASWQCQNGDTPLVYVRVKPTSGAGTRVMLFVSITDTNGNLIDVGTPRRVRIGEEPRKVIVPLRPRGFVQSMNLIITARVVDQTGEMIAESDEWIWWEAPPPCDYYNPETGECTCTGDACKG